MKISLQNYEEYFVRLVDGELSEQEQNEVEQFLQQNPGLNTDLEAFRSTVLKPDNDFVYEGKELLKKGITMANHQEYFIRYVENDLSADEIRQTKEFLQSHPSLNTELNLFQRTILKADTRVTFPGKNKLKRRVGRVVPLYVRYIATGAVAAGLLILVLFRGFEWNGTESPTIAEEQVIDKQEDNSSPATNPEVKNEHINSPDSVIPAKKESQKNNRNTHRLADNTTKEKSGDELNNQNIQEESLLVAENIAPINIQQSQGLPVYRKVSRAHYLDSEIRENRKISSSATGWTSVASVIGSEILKLSGRGDLLQNSDTTQERKAKGPVAVSINTDRFSLYHKFFKKRNSQPSS